MRLLRPSGTPYSRNSASQQPLPLFRAFPSTLREQWHTCCGNMMLPYTQQCMAASSLHGRSSSADTAFSCRRLAHDHAYRDQDTGYLLSERTLAAINDALAEVGSENRARLPPDVMLSRFFEQAKCIAQVVDLLRKGVWNDELDRDLKSLGFSFSPPLVTQVLRSNIPCDVAIRFFEWLKHVRRFKHNEFTYGTMLNTLGRAGRLQEMQQLFDEMKVHSCMVTQATLSSVMLWYSRAKDMRGVANHWRFVRQSGTKPSSAMYAAHIDSLVRAKRYTEVPSVFEEMLQLNGLPNSRLYSVFIEHLVVAGKVDAAAKMLRAMQIMHVVPSRVTFITLINGYAGAGDVERVLELLVEMKEHFHRPTRRLMPTVRALQASGKSMEAGTLLEEILPDSAGGANGVMNHMSDEDDDAEDSKGSLTDWGAVPCLHVGFDLHAFAQALHTWSPRVGEMLEQADMQWDRSLVMQILKQLRSLECLWSFFHWLKDKAGFRHDSYSCALLAQRILKSKLSLGKKASWVKELFEGMLIDGMKFTIPMFNLVMRHYVAAGEGDRAYRMFKLMKEFEVDPNAISYGLVIQGLAKNCRIKRAKQLMEAMQRDGFLLDSSTRAEWITCLGSVGELAVAYGLFQSLPASGKTASAVEYKAMIGACARTGDNTMAVQMYDQMREAGIAPTQDMYEVVRNVLKQTKQANRRSDLDALARDRELLDFLDGDKKVLQERLLQVLFLFLENIKPRLSRNFHLSVAN